MSETLVFNKPALTIPQQIELLRSRGLGFDSPQDAARILTFIGYYRLSGYAKIYLQKDPANPESFIKGTTFERILSLYNFDRKLRILVLGEIERIEVAIKAVLSNTMSLDYGAHWYMEQRYFNERFQFRDFLERLKVETGFENKSLKGRKKQDPIFSHYYSKYKDPSMPPSWMMMENVSIGTVSLVFERLGNKEDKKKIAKAFSTKPWVLQSWLHSLSYVRNICAHHGRLYNRHFKITPVSIKKYQQHFKKMNSFYTQAVIMHLLLQRISPTNATLGKELLRLLEEHPEVENRMISFPEGWEQDVFWEIS